MLLAADAGFLFHAPDNVRAEFPQLPAFDTYDELAEAIAGARAEPAAGPGENRTARGSNGGVSDERRPSTADHARRPGEERPMTISRPH